MEMLKLCAVAL